jgi:hypothetical protein
MQRLLWLGSLLACGCGGGGFAYVAKPGAAPRIATDELEIEVRSAMPSTHSGSDGWNIDIVVRNPSDHVVVFDPEELALYVPKNGATLHHYNHSDADSEPTYNYDAHAAFANSLPPGQSLAALVWFARRRPTGRFPVDQVEGVVVDALELRYHDKAVRLSPQGGG